MEKDYSLLRPFDLEAAKCGEPVAWYSDGETAKQVVFMNSGKIVIEWSDCGAIYGYNIEAGDTHLLRMAPLAWVEGKPVYKGDVLYWKAQRTSPCVAEKIMDGGWFAFRASDNEPCGLIHPDGLTWTPPKVKREGWIAVRTNHYSPWVVALASHVYESKEQAEQRNAGCTIIHIEWEE